MLVRTMPIWPSPDEWSHNQFRSLEIEILSHRPNAAALIDRLIERNPEEPLYFAVKALCSLIGGRRECRIGALACIGAAQTLLPDPRRNRRALVYLRAAQVWCDGMMSRSADILNDWVDEHPEDVLGLKICTAIRFMLGDMRAITRITLPTLRRLATSDFGYGFVLGCHAFALEELGEFAVAESFGRQAIELEPADAWAMHAVTHVFEMTNQSNRGLSWLESTQMQWAKCNNFAYHMAWHRGLFQLELGMIGEVLNTYDQSIRTVPTDDYRDISNAVSMLARLERLGVNVGNRWGELAEISKRRASDSTLVFAMLHYLLALVRVGDQDAVDCLLNSMRLLAEEANDQGRVAARVGLELATAIARTGLHRVDRAEIQALLDRAGEIGGSAAQRSVFSLWFAEGPTTRQSRASKYLVAAGNASAAA